MAMFECQRCTKEFDGAKLHIGENNEVVCLDCMMGKTERKAEALLKDKAKDLSKKMLQVTGNRPEAHMEEMRTIMSEVLDKFGGATGFAAELHACYRELSKRRPLPASAGQMLLAIAKLYHQVESQNKELDIKQMSNEQLEKEMQLEAMRIAMDASGNPEKLKAFKAMLAGAGLKVEEMTPEEQIQSVTKVLENKDEGDIPAGTDPLGEAATGEGVSLSLPPESDAASDAREPL